MKRSYRYNRPSCLLDYCMLVAKGLLVGLLLTFHAATARAITPAAQAEEEHAAEVEEKPTTIPEPERIFSGPQPGEKIAAFKVLQIKDGNAEEVEVARDADGTTLVCFVHKLSTDDRILYGLPLVDFYNSRQTGLDSHFVLLSDDRPKMLKMMRAWSRSSLFKASEVSLSVDGLEGPGFYGLNRNIAMTVVVAKQGKVVTNMALAAPSGHDLEAIMVAVADALEKPKPELAKVQQDLRAERQKELDKQMKDSPLFRIAPNEELGRIMFGLVNGRGNQSLIANRRRKQLLEWGGEDSERQSEMKKYCKAVLDGDFNLNRYSKAALQELAGE